MRIVGGRHRGRVLAAPPGSEVRPTSDRARESLFNILEHRGFGAGGGSPIPGARALDAFAGTGALGLEALSRGAAHLTCLDMSRAGCAAISDNAKALGEAARVTVLQADATRPPRAAAACDIVFLDPPYGSGLGGMALAALAEAGWIAEGALAVLEIGAREEAATPAGFELLDERRYGKARILFLRRCAGPSPSHR